MRKYDIAVIGSGVAGSTAAYALRDAGKKVALIEEDLWGGTCPNRGCDPKKVLISGVEAFDSNNQLAGKGFAPVQAVRWPELMAFKRTFTAPYPAKFEKEAREYGLDTIEGSARFVDGTHIEVNDETIEADIFVIATGQRPLILEIEGKEYLQTSADFLEMDDLPRKITFLGAGFIAFELSAIARSAGSEVSIIDNSSRPLRGFDRNMVDDLVAECKRKGIRFSFDVHVQSLKKQNGRFLLTGEGFAEETDCVICAAGRIPNVEVLDLEKAGVAYDGQGIQTDEYLCTSNPAIYACGDVLAKKQPRLTPVASLEGKYVARRILDDALGGLAYPPITSVVYASPKLAQVGVTAEEAEKAPEKYTVKQTDMTGWFSYRRVNAPIAKAKLIFEGEKLVGACALSGKADDLVNYLTMAMGASITPEEMQRMVFGWPTLASDLSSLI